MRHVSGPSRDPLANPALDRRGVATARRFFGDDHRFAPPTGDMQPRPRLQTLIARTLVLGGLWALGCGGGTPLASNGDGGVDHASGGSAGGIAGANGHAGTTGSGGTASPAGAAGTLGAAGT